MNYRDSGLYEGEKFYKVHYDLGLDNDQSIHNIHYSSELREGGLSLDIDEIAKYYNLKAGIIFEEDNSCTKADEVTKMFLKHLTNNRTVYYEPSIFDKEIALICDLIPFSCKEKKLLVLGDDSMLGYNGRADVYRQCLIPDYIDTSDYPRLDAYQFLVHGTVDKNSPLFLDPFAKWGSFPSKNLEKSLDFILGNKELAEKIIDKLEFIKNNDLSDLTKEFTKMIDIIQHIE